MLDRPALSIVIVAYDMGRELPRTVRSLSPPYQREVGGGTELIVIDNGSPSPLRTEDLATGLPLTLEHVRDPTPSPVPAINAGLARARGDVIGVWIDGARLASPGLVAACEQVCRMRPRALAATPNFHLGPKPQYENPSYTPETEDALLASIDWPADGYRLFEISSPAALSGLDGPMLETNAPFMRREMWDELGGYDPAFASPGGGAANPDLFRRALGLPGAELIKIQGEATFHQIHGGVTSNTDSQSSLRKLAAEYARLRGAPLSAVRGRGRTFDPATGTVSE